jgi:glycosyltransferase involved in cell wall biosynthesis
MINKKNNDNGYPQVTVIVPVKNAEKTIDKLLDALLQQDYPPNKLQVIIVDNGSGDGTPEIIKKYPFIMEYETGIASSYAARNKGLSAANGGIIAFTDSDCLPKADWIRKGVETLLDANADMAGGKVSFILSDPPSAAEMIDSITYMQNEDNIKNKRTAVTANLFVRKNLFEKVGLFAEASSGEDFNWTRKATQKGFSLVYAPEAIIYHPARKMRELL